MVNEGRVSARFGDVLSVLALSSRFDGRRQSGVTTCWLPFSTRSVESF